MNQEDITMPKSPDEKIDGAKIAARILNSLPESNKERLMRSIEAAAPEVITKIQENLVSFDDIADVTAQGIQALLRNVDHKDLVISLKEAKPETKEAVFKGMSERKKQAVEEDLAMLPPISLTEVEQAKKKIVVKLDELRAAGLIKTHTKGEPWVA